MTAHSLISHIVAGAIAFTGAHCFAQTQTVTLVVANVYSTNYVNYAVATNQIVQVMGYAPGGTTPLLYVEGYFQFNGTVSKILLNTSVPYTSLTNIFVYGGSTSQAGAVTLSITTPTPAMNVVSNYIPADAIVIPASVTGNVQIILESSPDLVNWTAASPGIYGASAGTNRFFRVRAAVSP